MKRIVSLFLAVCMLASLAIVPVSADNTSTLTLTPIYFTENGKTITEGNAVGTAKLQANDHIAVKLQFTNNTGGNLFVRGVQISLNFPTVAISSYTYTSGLNTVGPFVYDSDFKEDSQASSQYVEDEGIRIVFANGNGFGMIDGATQTIGYFLLKVNSCESGDYSLALNQTATCKFETATSAEATGQTQLAGLSFNVGSTVSVNGVAPTLKTVSVDLPASVTDARFSAKTESDAAKVTLTNGVDDTSDVKLQANAASEQGTAMANKVKWTVTPNDASNGVSVVEGTGVITVSKTAKAGTYTFTATPDNTNSLGSAESVALTVARGAVAPYSVTADTIDTTLEVPTKKAGDLVKDYSAIAKLKDQFGDDMTGATYTWSLVASNSPEAAGATPTGVSLTSTGSLTVKPNAAADNIYLKVVGTIAPPPESVKEDTSVAAVFTIGLTKDSTLVPAEVVVSGGPTTAVEIPTGDPVESDAYTAVVYDQYGAEMNSEEVTWSISPTKTGVEMTADGKIKVSASAKNDIDKGNGTEFTVTATSKKDNGVKGDASGRATVKRATSVATSVAVKKNGTALTVTAGAATDAVTKPLTGSSEVTYTAKVLDQYGAEMDGSVTLSIDGGHNAIFTPGTGKLTVSSTQETGDATLTAKYSDTVKTVVTIKIADITPSWTGVSAVTGKTYGVKNSELVNLPTTGKITCAVATGNVELTGTYSIVEGADTISAVTVTELTVQFVSADVEANKPYNNLTFTKKVTVSIANATLSNVSVTQKTALTFNNTDQQAEVTESATAVNSQAVTFTYCATESGSYTDSVPSFKTAGEHTVYFKANAANHNEKTGSFKVTIDKATDNAVTLAPAPASDAITVTYNKTKVTLPTATSTYGSPVMTIKDSANQTVDADTGIINAGTYTVTYETAGTDDYNKATKVITVTVNPAALTLTGGDLTLTKVYDGTTTAATPTGALGLSGAILGDTVTASVTNVAAYSSADVGDAYSVVVTAELAGAQAANYTLGTNTTYTVTNAAITKATWAAISISRGVRNEGVRTIEVKLSDKDFFGTSVPKDAEIVSGSYTSNNIMASGSPALNTEKDTLTFTSAENAKGTTGTSVYTFTVKSKNYNAVEVTVTFTAMDKEPVVVSGVTITASASVEYNGEAVVTKGTLSIKKDDVTVEVEPEDITYKYFIEDNSDNLKETRWTPTTAENSGAAAEGGAPKYAGNYRLVITVSNETYFGEGTANFTIAKKDVTIKANTYAITKVYDGTPDAGTASGTIKLDGVLTGDASWYTLTPSGVPVYTDKNVKSYELTQTAEVVANDLFERNYHITNDRAPCSLKTGGDLYVLTVPATITAKVVALTWAAPADLVYSKEAKVPTATLADGSLVAADAALAVTVKTVLASGNATNVGKFTYKATGLVDGTNTTLANYKLPEDVTSLTSPEYTITPKPITDATVTLGAALKYNGQTQKQTVASVKLSDTWALTADTDYTVSGNEAKDVNATNYTLRVTGKGNYTGYKDVSWNIGAAATNPVTVTVADIDEGEDPVINVTGGYGLDKAVITFSASENGTFTAWDTTNAPGIWYAKVYISATISYPAFTKVVSFEVSDSLPFGSYALYFISNGGTSFNPVYGSVGTEINLNEYRPARAGYTFAGWYTEKGLVNKVDKVTLDKSKTVYAKWEKNDCTGGSECPASVFTDLNLQLWYHDGIHFCVENGYMDGVGGGKFNPDGTTTRAMIVTILWRMEGCPKPTYACAFKDVAAGQWYTEAIAWAQENHIVDGMSDTEFAPNKAITREQLATILYRFAAYKGYDVYARASIASYTDNAKVSSWALKAVQWAVAEGIISGVTDTTLVPGGNATRAQVATMIQRYCQNID